MPRVRPVFKQDLKDFGKTTPPRPLNPSEHQTLELHLDDGTHASHTPEVDRTLKVYIAGKQARPDAPYVRPIFGANGKCVGQVSEGNRKDIRNAVEAAHAAWPGWGKRAAHNRAQIVYYL